MAQNAARKPAGDVPGPKRYVSYFRVSTDRQGASGLGLDAQRQTVSNFATNAEGTIVAEFQEIESGKTTPVLRSRRQ